MMASNTYTNTHSEDAGIASIYELQREHLSLSLYLHFMSRITGRRGVIQILHYITVTAPARLKYILMTSQINHPKLSHKSQKKRRYPMNFLTGKV